MLQITQMVRDRNEYEPQSVSLESLCSPSCSAPLPSNFAGLLWRSWAWHTVGAQSAMAIITIIVIILSPRPHSFFIHAQNDGATFQGTQSVTHTLWERILPTFNTSG